MRANPKATHGSWARARHRQVVAALPLAAMALFPAAVSASTGLNVSGEWTSNYHCEAGWCAGQDFAGGATLVQKPGSDEVTAEGDSSWHGTLSGHVLKISDGSPGGYQFTSTVTISADGSSWSGRLSDSNGTSGRDTAHRTGGEVSGTVYVVSCDRSSCSKKGLSGQDVRLKGTDSSGADFAETTKTDDSGAWSIFAPPGSYTAEPVNGQGTFDPQSRHVSVTSQSAPDQNFQTCASNAGTAAAGLATRGATGAKSLCGPDGIDWRMPNHLSVTMPDQWGSQSNGLPESSYLYPKWWKADVFLTDRTGEYSCDAGERWVWNVALPADAHLKQPIEPGCRGSLEVSQLGDYRVTARQEEKKDGTWKLTGLRKTQTVKVNDLLIVAMGDSNASGEGNPPFFYPRCNRSITSYQFRTAMYVEEQDPRSSVSLVWTGCSGARIEHLVNESYRGINEGSPALPPQIHQVRDLLLDHGSQPIRRVDAVLLSAGINDLTFGPILSYCYKWASGDCNEEPVLRVGYYQGFPDEYDSDVGGNHLLAGYLAGYQSQLRDRFAPLAAALKESIASGGLGVEGNRVFASRYPDFSYDEKHQLCHTTFARSVWSWLSDNAVKLNNTIVQASSSAGWAPVPVDPLFLHRGYCAPNSLFVSVPEALRNGDQPGAFHPNDSGHMRQAIQTEPLVCRRLFGNADCTSKP